MILLLLMFTFIELTANKQKLKPYMIAAHLGALTGFSAMALSPSINTRLETLEEAYSGIVAFASRLYRCLLSIDEVFFELLCLFIVATILIIFLKKNLLAYLSQSLPFFIAGIATCFALVLIPQVTLRSYFGAGLFLIIACLRAIILLFYDDKGNNFAAWSQPARYIILALLWLWLLFDYQKNLVNLARIQREGNERIAIIEEAKANGLEIAVIPQHHPQFANRYSAAHRHDLLEEPGFWINHFYARYYGIRISAIPCDEWNSLNR
jgi:hypothetical protein